MKSKQALMLGPAVAAFLALVMLGEDPAMSVLRNPLAVLGDRSPGERDQGALFNTKPLRQPIERVLPQVRERPAPLAEVPPIELPLSERILPEEPSLFVPAGMEDPMFNPVVFALVTPPSGPGGVVPPPGGVGGVPEPTTWAMMILGVFGTGFALRRANRRKITPANPALSPTR